MLERPRKLFDASYAQINHTHDELPPNGKGAVYTRATRQIISGDGLVGGGDLTTDRTLAVGAGTGITVNANDVSLSAAVQAQLALASSALQPGADHGLLGGLTDDDHTQYVLRSILTTDGDIFVRSGGAIARLGIGTDGKVLSVVSGAPAWADAAAGVDEAGDYDWTGSHTFTSDMFVGGDASNVSALIPGIATTDESLYGIGSVALFNAGLQPTLSMVRVNTSFGSPSAVTNSNGMFQLAGYGYYTSGGTGLTRSMVMDSLATENFTSSAAGTRLRIRTCATGSTTLTEAVSIWADRMLIPTISGDPSSVSDGQIWYNSSTKKFRGRANGVSVDLH